MFGNKFSNTSPKKHIAHVIVCGNEKGGSGKSTLSMHIAVSLMNAGHKVATIDLDSRQQSLTNYIENRRTYSAKNNLNLAIPTHMTITRTEGELVIANNDAEGRELAGRIALIESNHDFVVIDTPGSDTFLQRLAHLMADTLVTPINDSFIDFDVLAKIEPETYKVSSISQYAETVRNARRVRHNTDNSIIDWVVVRNRLSSIQSRNTIRLEGCLNQLAVMLGFRVAGGVTERVIFRELFPIGLTALDELDVKTLGSQPTFSHLSARNEIRALIATLNLPSDQKSREKLEQRKSWLRWAIKPRTPQESVLH